MHGIDAAGGQAGPIAVVAPSLRRARSAVRALGGRWRTAELVAASLDALLERVVVGRVLLCPEGRVLSADLAFLRRARERILWTAPDSDLRAAIAGLRGGHPPALPALSPEPRSEGRKRALLLEGEVTAERASAALASDARLWIVESPLVVRLTARHLRGLARLGVRWSALEPVRVEALLASPALARARSQWRGLLPARTKVRVLR